MLALDRASRFAEIALGHVAREYPNKLDHVLAGPADLQTPRALHPIFYGSFDWHSCVHGYWLLASVLRRYPDLPQAGRIHGLFTSALTHDNVAVERAYLARPMTRTFERPYGWAWLLKLAAELTLHPADELRGPAAALAPLADDFSRRFLAFLPIATLSGSHRRTFQHRIRDRAGPGLCQSIRRRRSGRGADAGRTTLVLGGCRLPGMGTRWGRLPVAKPHGSRMHAPGAFPETHSVPGLPASFRVWSKASRTSCFNRRWWLTAVTAGWRILTD